MKWPSWAALLLLRNRVRSNMNLKEIRSRRGLAVNVLAERAHVSTATIAKIERGEKVRLAVLLRLSEVLGCTPTDIDPDLDRSAAMDPIGDPHLAQVIDAWDRLSFTTRGRILDLVAQEEEPTDGD